MVALETLSLVLGALFLVVVVSVVSCLKTVDAGTSVIAVRFGRPHRTFSPGLHVKLPVADTWFVVKTGIQRAEFSCEALTADHQRVRLSAELRFKVRSAGEFLSAERVFYTALPATCEAAAGELIARYDLDQLMLKREHLRDELRFIIDDRVLFAGVSVEDVHLATIEPARRIGQLRAERTVLSHERDLTRDRLGLEREVRLHRAETWAHELREFDEVAVSLDEKSFRLLRDEALAEAVRHGAGRFGRPVSSFDDSWLRR